ncbi:MAG: DUF3990 domain-containing protein [Clostridia bacterium]|nr:DUF3990 domain-containing protein [Clostridia bacterium]
MTVEIYHGSEKIITRPEFGSGNPYNDYGPGFYCTETESMAMEWAVGPDRSGFVSHYSIECDGLSVLDLNSAGYSILNWLAILINNRKIEMLGPLAGEAKDYITENFLFDYGSYDIITGYRADDSYFSFVQDFLNGSISLRQLGNAMNLGRLGTQFVLKSRKAFERICFLKYEKADCETWYPRRYSRDSAARRHYFDVEKNRRLRDDVYITQIMDRGLGSDDLCI